MLFYPLLSSTARCEGRVQRVGADGFRFHQPRSALLFHTIPYAVITPRQQGGIRQTSSHFRMQRSTLLSPLPSHSSALEQAIPQPLSKLSRAATSPLPSTLLSQGWCRGASLNQRSEATALQV